MKCFIAAFLMVIVAIALITWVIFPTDRVMASWKQVQSDKGQDIYEASLIERDVQLFYGPFDRRLELQIHRVGSPRYGHSVPIRLFGNTAAQECKSSCTVTWGESGVEFVQASGHRLFIPATTYMGGR
jgi:hypothetical protein